MNRFRSRHPRATASPALLVLVGLITAPAPAVEIVFDPPDFDRWNYPFNGTPGFRGTAPTFGAVGEGAFDDRDGQFIVGFRTVAALPPLPPGQSYDLISAVVTVTHETGGLVYDPTYDSYRSHLDPGDTDFVPDSDAGRPLILSGASVRPPFLGYSFGPPIPGPPFFEENEAFAFGDPTLTGIRNAHASIPGLGDISNNVKDRFDFNPFAVGTTNLSPGDPVVEGVPGISAGSTFTFDVNLSDPAIRAYFDDGIDLGGIFLTITSLHPASQGGLPLQPNFYTSNSFDPAATPPTLTLNYRVVPLPAGGVGGAVLMAMVIAAARRRAARRRR